MRFWSISALALAADTVHGYLDTSPFFIFSTSEFLASTSQLQSAASLAADISLSLSQCPSDHYIIISQPGVHTSDFLSPQKAPTLSHQFRDEMDWANFKVRSRASVSEVAGSIPASAWIEILETTCGAQTVIVTGQEITKAIDDAVRVADQKKPLVLFVDLPSPPVQDKKARESILLSHDRVLAHILKLKEVQGSYTVLYTTSPTPTEARYDVMGSEGKDYEMESQLADLMMHAELKRDLGRRSVEKRANDTLPDGPLFERYQFLSPGIYMGFSVGLLLLLILYVAISGVASLQVSYLAFEKDQSQASKKTQ